MLTYGELHREVCKFANVLTALGVAKGDRVAIYMPLIPEAAIAMLACARIGAPHTVVFGGFSAESLRDRIHDAGRRSSSLQTAATGAARRAAEARRRRGARGAARTVESVVVVQRTGQEVAMTQRPRPLVARR